MAQRDDKTPSPGQEPERQRGRDAPQAQEGTRVVRTGPPDEPSRVGAPPLPPVGEPPEDSGRDTPTRRTRNEKRDDHTSVTHHDREGDGPRTSARPDDDPVGR